MTDTRLAHLFSLLESKNRTIRAEAAAALGRYSIENANLVQCLLKSLSSPSWDARVSAGTALHSILSATRSSDSKSSVSAALSPPSDSLRSFDTLTVLRAFRPLLSTDSTELSSLEKCRLSRREQRQLIDEHLDLLPSAGVSCNDFILDKEFNETNSRSHSSSPRGSVDGDSHDLGKSTTVVIDGVKKEEVDEAETLARTEDVNERKHEIAVCKFTENILSQLADQRWQSRHGAALALSKVFISCYSILPPSLLDSSALRLLQVLVLDQFNDFVSGRNATAPVRETCAQALGHMLFLTDAQRREVVLEQLIQMLQIKGDKLWHCRQSSLLVMKYFFSVASAPASFDRCFSLVVSSLSDPVDDVICCAVNTLASFIANESTDEKRAGLVERIMENVWQLLTLEAKKDQLRSGLDALAIDLLGIVDTWIKVEPQGVLGRDQVLTLCEMIDAAFVSRTLKIVLLLDMTLQRGRTDLSSADLFRILKTFYRILLFAPPTDSLPLLEQLYFTTRRLVEIYKDVLLSGNELSQVIGMWIGCILFDNVNPLIDVYLYGVEGPSSTVNEPKERMGSEEMRFLTDREKDDVYVTRKILAAKFLALLLELLYESDAQVNGQPLSLAIQLLFTPFFHSTSIYPVMGAAILINEWAALYQAVVSSGRTLEAPFTLIQLCDSHLRGSPVSFDELTSSINHLTQECNEFIDYCCVRGCDRAALSSTAQNVSIEDLSRLAYESCRTRLTNEKDVESLDARFRLLSDSVSFTKLSVRANNMRISAFLSSALFYFSFVPEKMTPMIKPLVDCLFAEENETVASEIFRGSVPRLVIFSWQRNPRPYVKVLARTFEAFSQCRVRIPSPEEWADKPNSIVSLEQLQVATGDKEKETQPTERKLSAATRNAQLFFIILSSFSSDQLPEFYTFFNLDEEMSDEILMARFELIGCLAFRLSFCLTDNATKKIFTLLASDNPAKRLSAAKAIATFARSQQADTMNRVHSGLLGLARDLQNDTGRRAAAEVLYRLSLLDSSLAGVISLLAPLAFSLIVDKVEEVRNMAGEAFRHFMPLLMLESPSPPSGLSPTLLQERERNIDFIHVLSAPSKLPIISRQAIKGLTADIEPRHYQLEGITWMRFLRRYHLNGILADDMGLGKTLQCLCAVAMSVDEDSPPARCSLIVCPRTLVDHWCNEWRRFFPSRLAAKKEIGAYKTAEIIVIGYDDLKSSPSFAKKTWNYVVLDEGHVMRNAKTQVWKAANELKAHSRLILSGTPVQNSPSDLWALFEWLMPGYLGTEKQFRTNFLRRILRTRGVRATEKDMQDGHEAMKTLHKLVLPFVLRRLKNEVLKELPPKTVQDYDCQLTERQKDIYRFIVDRCMSRNDSTVPHISPLHALIALRQLVDHPLLIKDVLFRLQAPQEITVNLEAESSGKMEALSQLLNECGICKEKSEVDSEKESADDEALLGTTADDLSMPSHRALIFCQWKCSVRLVSRLLNSLCVSHLVLDGDVPPNARQSIVDRFNTDPAYSALILTTHIGGVGLNLVGADIVLFLDHDFNPMKDLQAIDRAHRIGQQNKVMVYRLVTKGTVEERVSALCKFKTATAEALIGAENASLRSMETNELMDLFALEGDEKPTGKEPAKKRSKRSGQGVLSEDEKWNLEDMWTAVDEYSEQFDIGNFMRTATKTTG